MMRKHLSIQYKPVLWSAMLALVALIVAWFVIDTMHGVDIFVEHLRFQRPWAAVFLIVPIAFLIVNSTGQPANVATLLLSRGRELARFRPTWKHHLTDGTIGMRTIFLVLLALALMGPQSIHANEDAEFEGIDIMLTLDMSLSMRAIDIEPNRFSAAKRVVDDFMMRRPSDRMGAVIFGREAFTLMPLTADIDSLRSVVAELQLGLIDGRGTAIGNAVGTSLNRLRASKAKSKVLILLTDGISNSGNISPEQAAELARLLRVKMYAVLMGQADTGKPQQRDMFSQLLMDRGTFPINPELLQRMAQTTGGEYFQVDDRAALEQSFHTILNKLEKSQIRDRGRVYGDLYSSLIFLALGFFFIEVIVSHLMVRRWP